MARGAYIKKHGEYIREEDRTPVTFFRDLVDTVQYEGSEGERFYTFGWCSEREMAFCAAARLMGYKAIVVASGNHAYSVVETGDQLYIVDNTLNHFYPSHEETEMPTPASRLEIWYNQKVTDQYLRLKNILVRDVSWETAYERASVSVAFDGFRLAEIQTCLITSLASCSGKFLET